MKYEDLTLHQLISLKGCFETEPSLQNYLLVKIVFGFKKAVEYFLDDDLNALNVGY